MVRYDYILKAIKEYLQKCPATLQAKKIGSSGIWTTETDNWGEKIDVITYDDGTTIKFNQEGIADYYNEEEMFYPSEIDAYTHGENLHYNLEYTHGLYAEFTHFKMSSMGMKWNEYLRGLITEEQFYKEMDRLIGNGVDSVFGPEYVKWKTSTEVADLFFNNNEEYAKMCRETSLNGYGNFITGRKVQRLHDNDNIDRRIFSDKGYTSSTLRVDSLEDVNHLLDNPEDSWTIITEYHNGNPANKGITLRYAEIMNHGQDWDEVLNAPYQKFKRKIIDEKNKIIVQEPYEP